MIKNLKNIIHKLDIKKAVIIYCVVLVFGGVLANLYHSDTLNDSIFSNQVVIGFTKIKTTDLSKDIIFATLQKVEEYPKILPNNIISVNIINQTDTSFGNQKMFTEEKMTEAGVIQDLIIKHEFYKQGYKYKITVMNGDARDSNMIIILKDTENGTEINTETVIKVRGLLSPFGHLARGNLESAISTSIDSLIEYVKKE